jgi:hypothetical protein
VFSAVKWNTWQYRQLKFTFSFSGDFEFIL